MARPPDLTETRGVSSPRVHQAPLQSSQSRSTPASKFRDQSPVNSTLLNNPALLAATPLDAALGVDYHQPSVSRTPRVYVSPAGPSADQLARVPAFATPDARQYSRTFPDYGGEIAPGAHRDVPDPRGSYPSAPAVLPMQVPTLEQIQPDVALINRLLRQHMESLQAVAPGLSTAAGEATRDEAAPHPPAPRQFDPLTFAQPFQYRDANVLLSDQPPPSPPRMREYGTSDATVAGAAPVGAKLPTYPTTPPPTIPEMKVVGQVGPLPGYMDYTLRSPQKSEDEGSTRSLTSDDVDDLIRRNERLLWRNADIGKSPRPLSSAAAASDANPDENGRTTAILENELDRYISNIRKLHREHGVQSQEEVDHEQNTSGDLLNVTLSEDAQELPVEDKARKERPPEDMSRILALASDLASGTADSREVARPTERDGGDAPAEVEDEARHRADEPDGAPESEEKRAAEGHEDSAAAYAAKSEIREVVATQPTELEQPRADTTIATGDWSDDDDLAESRVRQAPEREKGDDAQGETSVSSNSGLPLDEPRANVAEQKRLDLVAGEESDVDGVFDSAEALAPWDLASMQKSVRELRSDERAVARRAEGTADSAIGEPVASESPRVVEQSGADGDQGRSRDTLPPSGAEAKEPSEAGSPERNDTGVRVEEAEPSEISSGDVRQDDEAAVGAPRTAEKLGEARDDSEKREIGDETTSKARVDDRAESAGQDSEYNVGREYAEEPSQAQQYQEQQDPSVQYDYGQGAPYEGAGNEEYGRFADQGYAQEGQQYVEYVEGQYEQYAEEPGGQQQYQHDPNAQYEQDPNQAYDYSYDQQYDPGQGYEGDPNQAYQYTEEAAYDPNQTYEGAYEQEYKGEQQVPEDNVGAVDSAHEGASETQEASLQRDPRSEQEVDGDEDRPRQAIEAVDEADQAKKKKKDVIKSLLDSDTDTTIERNVSNTESDFDFN